MIWPKLHDALRYPIVIDGRNLFNPEVMGDHGFIYTSVGRRDVPHEFANLRKSTTFVDRNPEVERTAAATAAKVT